MFKSLIAEMIDGGTLPPLSENEQEKLNSYLYDQVVFWIVEVEDEREYLK